MNTIALKKWSEYFKNIYKPKISIKESLLISDVPVDELDSEISTNEICIALHRIKKKKQSPRSR